MDLARLGVGALALTRPGTVLRLTGAEGAQVAPVVRLLGARYVAQGAAGLVVDRRWLPAADAAVDALHALSMVAAAAVWPGHRRPALASAAVASAFALADLADRP